MSSTSNKKRKLNRLSAPAPLSAVAARKSLQNQKTREAAQLPASQGEDRKNTSPAPVSETGYIALSEAQVPKAQPAVVSERPLVAVPVLEGIEDEQNSSELSSAETSSVLTSQPAIVLSSLKPNKDNVRDLEKRSLLVKLAPGERLVILGRYDISVRKGRITLLGATLLPSKVKHRVYAPLSHSLPVVRCLAIDVDDAEICLHQCGSDLSGLKSLSPLFSRLWNDGEGPLGSEYRSFSEAKEGSFQILFSSAEGPKRAYLQPIISAPEWNEALSNLSAEVEQKSPRIMLCGPKSSGKSTFTKLLSNRLLSAAAEKSGTVKPKKPNLSGVAILDLDPGQPEYSVPGQLSLVHVQDPNLGPPFTHPVPDGQGKIVRAHTIAAITPSIDPSHYMACTLDLFSHYRDLLSTHPKCPLIINTPGWVLGTGLEILVDLITRIRPTEVVYMSQKGPTEVVEALQEAAKSTPLITLPSQVSDYATKTAAHLRVMQLMSYFHLKGTEKGALTWSDLPLASVPPWEIKYSGDNTGMLGIMCYGEQPPPDLLFDSVNGSLVGIVVIDDTSAIPGWEVNNGTNKEESSENDQPYLMDVGDVEIRAIDEDPTIPGHLEQPVIVRTPDHSLPYFNPANAISLDPKHSHCIGLALVRGIDVPRQRLQVITPIPASLIEEVSEAGKSIVLVSGKLDTPGWAYTEELMQKQWLEKAAKNQSNVDDENVEETYDEGIGQQTSTEHFRRTPWIERQEGSQGRVAGSRVWRVRRDLGRWAE